MLYVQSFDWETLPQRRADVLVIGGGLAGLTAGLELAKDRSVVLLGKTDWRGSATAYAQGGVAAALAPDDNPAEHQEDTLVAGAGLSEPAAVQVLVREGPPILEELLASGLPFDQRDGRPAFTREGAHRRARILHAGGDATGRVLAESLARQAQETPRLQYEVAWAIDLLQDADGVFGVLVYSGGRLWAYLAGAVVLATGGTGRLYWLTTNPVGSTGDGIAMAYRAGATLADLEFVQFHPTALARPTPSGERFLISEAVRGEGAVLRNAAGEAFMGRYHPAADLGPRDVVARAIFSEMNAAGTESVWLDATGLGARWPDRFPTIFGACRELGLDPRIEPIPVAPAAHFFDGGVRTDLHGRTDLPGLWAAGEAAAVGVHGANRLASNSLLEGLVFGRRVAADILADRPRDPSGRRPHPGRTEPRTPDLERLRRLMWQRVGIERDEAGLSQALSELASWQREDLRPLGDPAAWEDLNLLTMAELVTTAARQRRESRGNHQRSDYPESWPQARHQLVQIDRGWREVTDLWS